MNLTPRNGWLLAALIPVILAGGIGYLAGSGAAIGKSEAERVREESYRAARDRAAERVAALARRRGFAAGLRRGRAAGERVGMREGVAFGGGETSIQSLEGEIAAAQASAAAARSEISARQANCGVVARAPGWCPTADELAAYRAAVRAAREARAEEERREERHDRE